MYDLIEDPPHGIMEFKNLYTTRNNILHEAAITKKGFCLNFDGETGKLTLNQYHDYSYQIQYTMYCTQHHWCDVAVRTKDFHAERIYYQAEFWLNGV